jgi:histidinol phosphatase-like enzyme
MHVFIGNANEMKHKGLQLIRSRHPKKKIAFFDIDDTLLDAKKSSSRASYLPPIKPIIDLAHAAQSNGMHVVIVTARPDSTYNRRYTEDELRHYGINFDLLYMCPPSVKSDFEYFKKLCRLDAIQRLRSQPLFAIGDREWDFGEHGGVGLWIQP